MNTKWTKEKCQEEALKYNSRYKFQKKSNGAYTFSYRNGWLNDICSHMISTMKPTGYWNFEKCKEESLKYKNRTEFSKNSSSAYNAAHRNGWLDDICNHMIPTGNWFNRCIYSYEFPDNYVYVGLTYNLNVRQKNRDADVNDQVTVHIKKTSLNPIRKQLTDYIDINDAIKLEGFYVEKYKSEGWNILNKSKTGAIGRRLIKWTKEKCKEEALKYDSKVDFYKNNSKCYDAVRRNKWIDEVCSHMKEKQKPKKYWTKEKCKEEALKYKTKTDFTKNNSGVYSIVCKNKWIDDVCGHMIVRPNKIWTYDKCKKESLKYKTRMDYCKNSRGSYNVSYRNKWLDEFFA
jgi:hypothetical protein